MSETVEPHVGATPPHPMGVARVLKLSTRRYLSGGTSLNIVVAPVADFVHTAAKTITGTVTRMGSGVPYPASVVVAVKSGATTEYQATTSVSTTTGAFSQTVPANALAAGAKTAIATATSPAAVSPAVSFNVT